MLGIPRLVGVHDEDDRGVENAVPLVLWQLLREPVERHLVLRRVNGAGGLAAPGQGIAELPHDAPRLGGGQDQPVTRLQVVHLLHPLSECVAQLAVVAAGAFGRDEQPALVGQSAQDVVGRMRRLELQRHRGGTAGSGVGPGDGPAGQAMSGEVNGNASAVHASRLVSLP
jgi:hypothetical protein